MHVRILGHATTMHTMPLQACGPVETAKAVSKCADTVDTLVHGFAAQGTVFAGPCCRMF